MVPWAKCMQVNTICIHSVWVCNFSHRDLLTDTCIFLWHAAEITVVVGPDSRAVIYSCVGKIESSVKQHLLKYIWYWIHFQRNSGSSFCVLCFFTLGFIDTDFSYSLFQKNILLYLQSQINIFVYKVSKIDNFCSDKRCVWIENYSSPKVLLNKAWAFLSVNPKM